MSAIQRMERGKLCRLTGKNHYNLQAWHNGRNQVRYVRREEIEALQQAIEGYKLFIELAHEYAETIIQQTRREHKKQFPHKKTKRQKPPT